MYHFSASLYYTSSQILLSLSMGDKGFNHFRNTLADAHSFKLKSLHGIWWQKCSLVTLRSLLSCLNRYASSPTWCISWYFPHSYTAYKNWGYSTFSKKGSRQGAKHLTKENTLIVSNQKKSQSKTALVLPSMARDNNGLSTSNQLEHLQNHD